MRPQSRWSSLLLCLALSACAAGAAGGGGGGGGTRDPNVVTAEDLAGMSELTVADALQRLRPGWLRPRGASSVAATGSTMPVVMVNNVTHDGIGILSQLRSAEIRMLRFISGPDATTRFGTGYVNGIIEVTTH